MTRHPTTAAMATYIDDAATPAERRAMEAHLAECGVCREELIVVRGSLQTRSTRSTRLRWLAGAAATAAAIALLLVGPAGLNQDSSPVLRDGGETAATGGITVIEAITPRRDAVVDVADVRFVWRSAGEAAQYRFTLTSAGGDPVASVTTGDTVVAVPSGIELAPASEYFWWVDVLLKGGGTAETGLQRFRTAP